MTGTMTFRVVARDERLPPELQARLLERASGVSYHLVGIDPHDLQQIWHVGFSRWMLINFGPDIVTCEINVGITP